MITLRPYQEDIATKCVHKLKTLGLCYLSMEVRTGKTHTAIAACNLLVGHKRGRVVFVTKKKAISSIEADVKAHGAKLDFTVVNYESVHKVDHKDVDIVVLDEAHSIKSFPKKTERWKSIRGMMKNWPYCKTILMSGTPCPESYSELYYQFAANPWYNPFDEYSTFYKWAKDFVNITEKHIGHIIKDYSDADRDKVMGVLDKYFLTYTQSQAGFDQKVHETILNVPMLPSTYKLCEKLKKDLVVEGQKEIILADTGVKLMQKLHQMYSGTVKFESGESMTIDISKAAFIEKKFKGKKIAIFYKFVAEFEMLKESFEHWTNDPVEFNNSENLTFLGQIQSSREGINLSSADCLIFFNIDFSAVSYFQARDRLTSKDRSKMNKVFWIFSDGGIEERIYQSVLSKKDYTLSIFKRDFDIEEKKNEQMSLGL